MYYCKGNHSSYLELMELADDDRCNSCFHLPADLHLATLFAGSTTAAPPDLIGEAKRSEYVSLVPCNMRLSLPLAAAAAAPGSLFLAILQRCAFGFFFGRT
jgi:hypothetical protein